MSTHPRIEDDPALSDAAFDMLNALLASGWTAHYSPTCRAWWLRQAARGWSTSVYLDPNTAIQAAASVDARAEATTAERARIKSELRRELRG